MSRLRQVFLLGLVYRASYTDLLTEEGGDTKFNKTLETANVISNNVILIGDMNCDTNSDEYDITTNRLIDTCTAYQMTQLITNQKQPLTTYGQT